LTSEIELTAPKYYEIFSQKQVCGAEHKGVIVMLNIEIKDRTNIVVVTPDGAITAADIDRMAEEINNYINNQDRVPNLVIHTKSIPYWSNFKAVEKHLKFVKNHHQIVKKVAIVSDSKLLWLAKTIVDHFTGAKVRRFTEEALDDAVAWAEIEEDHPGSIEQIDGLPDDVIG
jgi:MFS superfamily sulfate permease-like transporter